jgi:predicted nuclease with RNAse H fold
MLFTPVTYIGIDPSGGRSPYTYAALDSDQKLLALGAGELDDMLAFVGGQQAAYVAVNAPSGPNLGLVRKKLEKESLTPGHPRRVEMRLAEYELRERGINVSPTPARRELCAAWAQMGFALYQRLEKAGYKAYPAKDASHQWLETHPHAVFCALLDRAPLPKPTLEGRLQRQLALHKQGLGIKDPMEFFEEITRHRLLGGILPMEMIYLPEELDAIAAALVASLAAGGAEQVESIGAKEEGLIVLPKANRRA